MKYLLAGAAAAVLVAGGAFAQPSVNANGAASIPGRSGTAVEGSATAALPSPPSAPPVDTGIDRAQSRAADPAQPALSRVEDRLKTDPPAASADVTADAGAKKGKGKSKSGGSASASTSGG
ncbi:MAG TPA: hypothetical protein VGE65_01260 [Sphingobium sp.]